MRLHMYAVFDKAVGAYMQPFFLRSRGEALRSFQDACSDGKSNFCTHPEDYVLFFVGEYDDKDGSFTLPPDPVKVVSALECSIVSDPPFEVSQKSPRVVSPNGGF
ncbi:nonstructural protein [Blackfly microvirus SF02]|uniref:Nonstructural protein n=1 Tax=Blackfly microvirus SF02 TaxID=2576452 RepID=A0A4P8PKJ1_9VIRU|nr:nonstructural protein [Blackfly microvirus SF02]